MSWPTWGVSWLGSWGGSWGPDVVEEHPELYPAGLSPKTRLILARSAEVVVRTAALSLHAPVASAEGWARVRQAFAEADVLPIQRLCLRFACAHADGAGQAETRRRGIALRAGKVVSTGSGTHRIASARPVLSFSSPVCHASSTFRVRGAHLGSACGSATAEGRHSLSEEMALLIYRQLRQRRALSARRNLRANTQHDI